MAVGCRLSIVARLSFKTPFLRTQVKKHVKDNSATALSTSRGTVTTKISPAEGAAAFHPRVMPYQNHLEAV